MQLKSRSRDFTLEATASNQNGGDFLRRVSSFELPSLSTIRNSQHWSKKSRQSSRPEIIAGLRMPLMLDANG